MESSEDVRVAARVELGGVCGGRSRVMRDAKRAAR